MKDRKYLSVPTAYTVYPSEEEFANPAAYIRSLADLGHEYGILKIVPPQSWDPPFCLDPRTFTIITRTQELNRMGLFTRATTTWLEHLKQFHLQTGRKPIDTEPPVNGKYHMNYYLLAHFVESFGGYERVRDDNLWGHISSALAGLASARDLKALYEDVELPYTKFRDMVKRIPKFSKLLRLQIERDLEAKSDSESEPEDEDEDEDDDDDKEEEEENYEAEKKNKSEVHGSSICSVCKIGVGDITCGSCKKSYHSPCLDPLKIGQKRTPIGLWWCPICLCMPPRYTYGPGEEQTLEMFREKCDKFKHSYISKNMHPDPTPEDIEAEFWALVSDTTETLEVEYGADLVSEELGSGFPRISNSRRDKYAYHPWNLNNLGVIPASLFRHLRNPISGVTSPWGYAGMLFSAFCWHSEDHFSYSINYHHGGATKTWYGIPARHAAKFEKAGRALVPEEFDVDADVLSGRASLLSPDFLIDNDIEVYAIHQNYRDFVITFPNAYHAGFNHGYNFNEAVNYSPVDWLGMGEESTKYYREMRHEPAFSQDELLYRTFIHEKDAEIRQKTAKYLLTQVDEEAVMRKLIRASKRASRCASAMTSLRKVEQDIDSDGYHCERCKGLPYFSRFKNHKPVYYCPPCFLDSKLELSAGEMRKFVFEVTREFTDYRLAELREEVEECLYGDQTKKEVGLKVESLKSRSRCSTS